LALHDLVVNGMNTGAAELTPFAILTVRNVLGEGILWDSRRQVLWWTDIQSRRLYRHDRAREQNAGDVFLYRVGVWGLPEPQYQP
jgi:sugar lactone lactonase YvrE